MVWVCIVRLCDFRARVDNVDKRVEHAAVVTRVRAMPGPLSNNNNNNNNNNTTDNNNNDQFGLTVAQPFGPR